MMTQPYDSLPDVMNSKEELIIIIVCDQEVSKNTTRYQTLRVVVWTRHQTCEWSKDQALDYDFT